MPVCRKTDKSWRFAYVNEELLIELCSKKVEAGVWVSSSRGTVRMHGWSLREPRQSGVESGEG